MAKYRIVYSEKKYARHGKYETQRYCGVWPVGSLDFINWHHTLEDAERSIKSKAESENTPREPGVFATYAADGTRIEPPESEGPLTEDRT